MTGEGHMNDNVQRILADEVMANLDAERASGALARQIRGDAPVVYEASTATPGAIVAIYADGRWVEGGEVLHSSRLRCPLIGSAYF
jgi:hypothetical protein